MIPARFLQFRPLQMLPQMLLLLQQRLVRAVVGVPVAALLVEVEVVAAVAAPL